jgi:hypothetical protein
MGVIQLSCRDLSGQSPDDKVSQAEPGNQRSGDTAANHFWLEANRDSGKTPFFRAASQYQNGDHKSFVK